jgi:hypothetical protein
LFEARLRVSRNIVFAIDVEPDERKVGRDDSWEGSAITLQELSTLRGQLQEATGAPVRLNWFPRFDPQIERTWGRRDWVTQACPSLVSTALAHGDFTGVHIHLWKWNDAHGDWFSDFADLSWRAECLQSSIDGYQAVFGTRPCATRFGDRCLQQDDVALLRQLKIRYDLSLEPGAPAHQLSVDRLASSQLPDYRRAPRRPYQPSPSDYLSPQRVQSHREGEGKLWMVPISVTRRSHWIPLRQPPYFVRTTLPFNLVLRPRRVWAELAAEMERQTAEPIVFVLRSGDLATPGFLANFRFVTQRMARQPDIGGCRFVGVDQAVEEFARSLVEEEPSIVSPSS